MDWTMHSYCDDECRPQWRVASRASYASPSLLFCWAGRWPSSCLLLRLRLQLPRSSLISFMKLSACPQRFHLQFDGCPDGQLGNAEAPEAFGLSIVTPLPCSILLISTK